MMYAKGSIQIWLLLFCLWIWTVPHSFFCSLQIYTIEFRTTAFSAGRGNWSIDRCRTGKSRQTGTKIEELRKKWLGNESFWELLNLGGRVFVNKKRKSFIRLVSSLKTLSCRLMWWNLIQYFFTCTRSRGWIFWPHLKVKILVKQYCWLMLSPRVVATVGNFSEGKAASKYFWRNGQTPMDVWLCIVMFLCACMCLHCQCSLIWVPKMNLSDESRFIFRRTTETSHFPPKSLVAQAFRCGQVDKYCDRTGFSTIKRYWQASGS